MTTNELIKRGNYTAYVYCAKCDASFVTNHLETVTYDDVLYADDAEIARVPIMYIVNPCPKCKSDDHTASLVWDDTIPVSKTTIAKEVDRFIAKRRRKQGYISKEERAST